MDRQTIGSLFMAFAKAGLAAGTTTTLTSANQVDYCIKGKMYRKATATNEATPTTDVTTGAAFVALAAGFGSVFVTCRDSSGNLKVAQGGVEALDNQGNFIRAPQFPSVPDTVCPYGYIVVKAQTGAVTWTFGSSNLAGPPSNVVIAYQDCAVLPDRPQAS